MGLPRCDSITLDFAPSQLLCIAILITKGSFQRFCPITKGAESLEEHGAACQGVLGEIWLYLLRVWKMVVEITRETEGVGGLQQGGEFDS